MRVEQPVAELPVAGDDPGPGHGLAFPRQGVLAPVHLEGVEAPGEGPAAPFGPEVGVDVVDPVGRGGAADEADEGGRPAAWPRRRRRRPARRGRRSRRGRWRRRARRRRTDPAPMTANGIVGSRASRAASRVASASDGQVAADLAHVGVAEHVACGDRRAGSAAASAAATPCCSDRPSRRWSAASAAVDQAVVVAGGESGRVGEPGHEVRVVAEDLAQQATRAGDRCTASGPRPGSRGRSRRTVGSPATRRAGCGRAAGRGRDRVPARASRAAAGAAAASGGSSGSGPRVSSITAAWVRRASTKPKALSRAAAASGLSAASSACGPGERLEQRAEVDPLVDGPDRRLGLAQLLVELLGRGRALERVPPAHHPGQAVEGDRVGGEGVDLLLVDELEPVLDRAQQAVGRRRAGRRRRRRRSRPRPSRRAWTGWSGPAARGRGGRARAAAAAR